jgi:hypothetical protein
MSTWRCIVKRLLVLATVLAASVAVMRSRRRVEVWHVAADHPQGP